MNLTNVYQELTRMVQDGQDLAKYLKESVERDPVLPFLTMDVASLRRHFIGIQAGNLLDRLNTALRGVVEPSVERLQAGLVRQTMKQAAEDMTSGSALEDKGLSPVGKLMLYSAQVEFYQRIYPLTKET
jgi:hypothetical protein